MSAQVRKRNVVAVEAYFPGLRCVRVKYESRTMAQTIITAALYITLEGTPEELVRRELTTQAKIDAIPACGVKSCLKRKGPNRVQVQLHWFDTRRDAGNKSDATDMAAKIGLAVDSAYAPMGTNPAPPSKTNVVQFPIRGANAAFLAGLTRDRVALYVPSDVPIERLAAGLASIGLRFRSFNGRLVCDMPSSIGEGA